MSITQINISRPAISTPTVEMCKNNKGKVFISNQDEKIYVSNWDWTYFELGWSSWWSWIPEAPIDWFIYWRKNWEWVKLDVKVIEGDTLICVQDNILYKIDLEKEIVIVSKSLWYSFGWSEQRISKIWDYLFLNVWSSIWFKIYNSTSLEEVISLDLNTNLGSISSMVWSSNSDFCYFYRVTWSGWTANRRFVKVYKPNMSIISEITVTRSLTVIQDHIKFWWDSVFYSNWSYLLKLNTITDIISELVVPSTTFDSFWSRFLEYKDWYLYTLINNTSWTPSTKVYKIKESDLTYTTFTFLSTSKTGITWVFSKVDNTKIIFSELSFWTLYNYDIITQTYITESNTINYQPFILKELWVYWFSSSNILQRRDDDLTVNKSYNINSITWWTSAISKVLVY